MDLQHNEWAARAAWFVAGVPAGDGANGAWTAALIGRTARIAARSFGAPSPRRVSSSRRSASARSRCPTSTAGWTAANSRWASP